VSDVVVNSRGSNNCKSLHAAGPLESDGLVRRITLSCTNHTTPLLMHDFTV
jgi:hypothetical protein